MKKVLLPAAGFILITCLAIGIGISEIDSPATRSDFKRDIFQEFIKLFIQLVFVGLAGGVLLQEYNRRMQRKSDLKAFRKSIYKSLVDTYLKTKQIRWVMRANCQNYAVERKTYRTEMSKIIEVKTNIEVLIHEIRSYSKPFELIEKPLLDNLKRMEDYLRGLLIEFHEHPLLPVENSTSISTKELRAYNRFISKVSKEDTATDYQSDFTLNYRSHFYASLDLLRDNELKLVDTITSKYIKWG